MKRIFPFPKKIICAESRVYKTDVLIIGALPPPLGGVTIHIARLAERLNQRGVSFTLLDEGKVPKPGVVRLRTMSPIAYLRVLASASTVHIHSSNHFIRLVHTLAARLVGRRVVHTVHSARGTKAALCALYLASYLAHERIGVSAEVARRLAGTSHVVPAFVPPSEDEEGIPFEVESWMRSQSERGRRVIAFNASRPSKIDGVDLYGLDMLIDALSDQRLDRFAAILCVSLTETPDNYYAEILARAEERGLGNRIRFQTGQIRFAGILKRADVFVRPTITDGDAISIREAIWYGVPAIASDAVIRPERTIIFPSRNHEGFVDAVVNAPIAGATVRGEDFAEQVIDILAPQRVA
jgi:glycosyltransferase involved in cell wall biosynthesis